MDAANVNVAKVDAAKKDAAKVWAPVCPCLKFGCSKSYTN